MSDVRTLKVSEHSRNYDPNENIPVRNKTYDANEDIPVKNKTYDSNENIPVGRSHAPGISITRLHEMCNDLNIPFRHCHSTGIMYLYTGDCETIYRNRRKLYNMLYYLAIKK